MVRLLALVLALVPPGSLLAAVDPPLPRGADALRRRVERLLDRGETARALARARLAERRHPAEGWFSWYLGDLLLRRTGDRAGALAAFDRALARGYVTGRVHYLKGLAAYHLGRHEDAVGFLQDSLRWHRRARRDAARRGDTRAAEAYRRRMADAYVRLTHDYEALGRLADAVEAAAEGLALDPGNQWLPGLHRGYRRAAGDLAFAAGRYDEAHAAYRQAQEGGDDWAWFPDLLEVVRQRQALGEVRPEAVHRILVAHVVEGVEERRDGAEVRREGVGPRYRERLLLGLRVMQRMVEAMSRGRWSLEIEEVEVRARFRERAPLRYGHPDHLDLGPLLFAREHEVDTVVIHCTFTNPAFSAGHFGGAARLPYIPAVRYGRRRGKILAGGGAGVGTLLHEFFHVLEHSAGGMPGHAFREPAGVRGWGGGSELGYYRWRFDTRLPEVGWGNLQFRRGQGPAGPAASFRALRRLYADVPLLDRQRANSLALEAEVQTGEAALRVHREVLTLSPAHPKALRALVAAGARVPGVPEEVLRRRLGWVEAVGEDYPEQAFYRLLREREDAVEVGRWSPEDLDLEGRLLEWDAGAVMDAPGTYRVSFLYDGGQAAVTIEHAELVVGGVLVSRDTHEGWSGNRKRDVVYTLRLPHPPRDARPVIRARMRGMRSVNSHGGVRVRRVEPDP